jgi:hypothetical protein
LQNFGIAMAINSSMLSAEYNITGNSPHGWPTNGTLGILIGQAVQQYWTWRLFHKKPGYYKSTPGILVMFIVQDNK